VVELYVALRVLGSDDRLMGTMMHARKPRIAIWGVALVATASMAPTLIVQAQTSWPEPKVRVTAGGSPAAQAPLQPAPVQAAIAKPLQKPATRPADLEHTEGVPKPSAAVPTSAGSQPTLPTRQTAWTEAEISVAQNACVALLKNLDIVAVGAPPVRDGDCGAAAPIELISVGKSPQVTFSPPVTVTCDMAAALHKWVNSDLQPLARKHLGAPLIQIDTMSSYSCRNAYGRTKGRLSEHGKANAVDIRAFLTAKAVSADVLAGWGPTARDVQAQVAAAKAATAKAEAIAKAQPSAASPTIAGKATGTLPPGTTQPSAVADSGVKLPGITVGPQGGPGIAFPGSGSSAIGLSTGMPPPSRLGGPKPPEAKLRGTAAVEPPTAPNLDGQTHFLRGAHSSACRIFGTVLGPEANNAHRNHFHVDMAARATSSFCE
jgi:hypothetical protein